ncbi:class I SAM-dependent methyltransferase [Thalassotalea sp. M1531]|uniref:Class I SAM-dependent methyltransferase n=1 Tax=Thalassotalea algicola TaxID=2716224 RepID=A0A7Y0LE63_9GAMM|nr:class I SAM-dependent methyltransferase [Thalassotalea algicola]
MDTKLNSIIDIGCGLGDMYSFLLSQGYEGEYLGLDFVEDFVTLANEKFVDHPKAKFQVFDINKQRVPSGYDYILLSGVFNNKTDDSEQFLYSCLRKMFAACEKGVGFNAMSTYVDFFAEDLYYSNPLEVFDFCKKELTLNVTLKHDYLVKEGSVPYEYTIFLHKQPNKE